MAREIPVRRIAQARLRAQHLVGRPFASPAECVRWFGAVQAQDYSGALWGIGQRTKGATRASIARAIADRAIVRTWPLRGTLHFVAAADVRWMLTFLAPRIIARAATMYSRLGIDAAVVSRSRRVVEKALERGGRLTRPALYRILESARLPTAEGRGLHILCRLAHDGAICFGPHDGKQPTFVLLDDWVPPAAALARDEALAELARRYFVSHGPATLHDFAWWSGLTIPEARRALESSASDLRSEVVDTRTFWMAPSPPRATVAPGRAWLLPAFDEYIVAYRDRTAILDPKFALHSGNGIFSYTVVVDGEVRGTWRPGGTMTPSYFVKPSAAVVQAVHRAAAGYKRFASVA
jgi:hypothetical protein